MTAARMLALTPRSPCQHFTVVSKPHPGQRNRHSLQETVGFSRNKIIWLLQYEQIGRASHRTRPFAASAIVISPNRGLSFYSKCHPFKHKDEF